MLVNIRANEIFLFSYYRHKNCLGKYKSIFTQLIDNFYVYNIFQDFVKRFSLITYFK